MDTNELWSYFSLKKFETTMQNNIFELNLNQRCEVSAEDTPSNAWSRCVRAGLSGSIRSYRSLMKRKASLTQREMEPNYFLHTEQDVSPLSHSAHSLSLWRRVLPNPSDRLDVLESSLGTPWLSTCWPGIVFLARLDAGKQKMEWLGEWKRF